MAGLDGVEVALTGRLLSMTRAEAIERIEATGGRHAREPGPATAVLVAGEATGHLTADGRIPRSLRLFRKLKRQGAPIRLVGEPEFLGMLGAADELADFSRLYTAAQVSRIVDVPASVVRSWVRGGLLAPARMASRLAWFEFKDILIARNLARLTSSGVPPSRILSSLSQLARWLPDGDRAIDRLEAYARGLRVRMPDGGWAAPDGQRLIDFHRDGREEAAVGSRGRVTDFVLEGRGPFEGSGAPVSLVEQAAEAEEQGELEAAALLYTRALESGEDAETLFNLGNVLYALGREGAAAERYLEALALDRDFAEAWNNLGNSLVALGRLQDGVHAYRMALQLAPDYAEPHCNLATVLERLDQPRESLAHRAACQRAFPSPARLTLLRQPAADDGEGG